MRIARVLVSDDIDAVCAAKLRQHRIEVDVKTKLTQEQLCREIEENGYDALLVRSATKVTDAVLNAGNLKLVGRAGTGVDNVDLGAATKRGIVVMNTPSGNSQSACELTCAMVMCLARRVPQAAASMKALRWDRKLYMGAELGGKTLAIVGLGRIGREVAHRMQAFGMTTIGFDPLVPKEAAAEFGVESLPLEEIWPRADYISLHVPLIDSTRDLLCAKTFSQCKRGVRVVNVARGGVINEADLLAALNDGRVAGAALDVFEQEPPTSTDLISHANVIATPHLGASTAEAQRRVAEEVAQNVVDIAQGRGLPGAVNVGAMAAALDGRNRPLLQTVQTCAQLCRALCRSSDSVAEVVIECPAEHKALFGAVRAAAVVGALKSCSSNGLNYLNAELHAKAAGLQVRVEESADSTLVCVRAAGRSVSACVTPLSACVRRIDGAPVPGVLLDGAVLIADNADVDAIKDCATGSPSWVTWKGGCLAHWPKGAVDKEAGERMANKCDRCAFVHF